MKYIVASSLAIMMYIFGQAAAGEDCSAAIVTERTVTNLRSSDQKRFALDLDEGHWREMQQNASGDVTIPIGSALLPLSASWSKVEQAQDTLKKSYRIESNSDSSGNWTSQKVAVVAYDAYKTCILHSAAGLSLALEEDQGNSMRHLYSIQFCAR